MEAEVNFLFVLSFVFCFIAVCSGLAFALSDMIDMVKEHQASKRRAALRRMPARLIQLSK